jgi:hypothetical protein
MITWSYGIWCSYCVEQSNPRKREPSGRKREQRSLPSAMATGECAEKLCDEFVDFDDQD